MGIITVDELTLKEIAVMEGKNASYTGYLRKQIEKKLLKAKMIGEKVYVVRRKDYEAWKAEKPIRGQRRDYMKNKPLKTGE